jgi:Septum formation
MSYEKADRRLLGEWVKQQLDSGRSRKELIDELERKEWPRQLAADFVGPIADAHDATPEVEAKRNPNRDFLIAGAAGAIGGAATIATYSAADPGEGFLILWGPAVFGALKFIQGAIHLLQRPASRNSGTIALAGVSAAALALAGAGFAYSISGTDWRNGTSEPSADPSLEPGDCVEDPGSSQFETLKTVSCDAPKSLTVTNSFQIDDQSSYPSSSEMDDIANEGCSDRASTYVYPSQESWAAGDRLIVCLG